MTSESSELATRKALPAFELELINGRSSSQGRRTQRISESITLIGAARQCGLWLRDEGVSKIHASLVLTGTGVWVVDLLGRDGLLVDDRPAYWKQLHDDAVLQIGRFRFRARYGARRDGQMQRVVRQESPETAPQAERAPSSRGSLSEESVMALFERMGELQSRFFEHSQLQMQMITQMLDHVGRSQQSEIRKDLDRIDQITRELEALKSNLPLRRASKPKRPAKKSPSRPKTPRGDPLEPTPQAPCAATEDPPRIIAPVSADSSDLPLTEVVAPGAPVAESTSAGTPGQTDRPNSQPDDASSPLAMDVESQSPSVSEAQAARLTQRMAHLARERNSVWQRVLTAFGGKSGR